MKRLLFRREVTGKQGDMSFILTHELGHFNGLPHTFGEGQPPVARRQLQGSGQGQCSNNDHFRDTAPQAGPCMGCPDEQQGGLIPGGLVQGFVGGSARLVRRLLGKRQADFPQGGGGGSAADPKDAKQVGKDPNDPTLALKKSNGGNSCVSCANAHNMMDYSTCSKKTFTPEQGLHMEEMVRYRKGLRT
ncbi:hypothetical protein CDD83_4551 [Cordyceps sp. RAO-2017]|nr:hypothetical protein CDD83_4551 [Cordyceps sp. RAO-2017]